MEHHYKQLEPGCIFYFPIFAEKKLIEKKSMKRMILLLSFLMVVSWMYGQITLEECRQKTQDNYPLVRQYSLIEKTKEYNLNNASKGNLPQFDKDKKICVFASHVHYDHFKKKIFTWAEEYENIHYILSDDIEAAGPKDQTEHIGADADFNIWDLRIHTLKSTDEGVAFLVRVKEKTFFHAGDLNWWYWEEEDDETWNEPMRQAYQKEIAKIEGEEIDYAFFPLDSRQGEESVLGINYFMQHTNTKIVFPMHMWGYDILDKFLKNSVSEPYRERIVKVKEPGQSFYFEEER